MSFADDFNPLEAIIPHLDSMLLRSPSPEVLQGARERFALISQAVEATTLAFAEIDNERIQANARITNIAGRSDSLLDPELIKLTPEASSEHEINTSTNAYNPPALEVVKPLATKPDNQSDMAEQARILAEKARQNNSNVIPIFAKNADGSSYASDDELSDKIAA